MKEPPVEPADEAVLVFSKTEGFRHNSIPDGQQAIMQIGQANDFIVHLTEDAADFQVDTLSKYKAVIFLSTTGDVLNESQQAAFEQYIQSGGGYVGIHSATDTEYDWAWYGQLVGAYFNGHPQIQDATLEVVDQSHIASQDLPAEWMRRDEWYNFRDIQSTINVLIEIDESSYEGGTNGDFHPMAWYQEFDGGRAFYTGGGHTKASFTEELFVKHLEGGILYAMGR